MKTFIASVIIGLLVPTAAMADSCDEDKTKFCKDVMDAGGKIGACLDQHLNELSQECKAYREARAAEKAKKKQTPLVKQEADSCDEDRTKFCKEIMDAGGKVGPCLDQHLNELSQGCKAEREAKAAETTKQKQTPPVEQNE